MSPVIETAHSPWSAARFDAAVDEAAEAIVACGAHVVATLLDNGPAWLVADAALRRAGAVHVPLPAFFTPAQRQYALRAAGVELLWTEAPTLGAEVLRFDDGQLPAAWQRLDAAPVAMPAGTAKITFTSGTTGTPKGVCLGTDAMERVARGIGEATAELGITRHLSALPFAVLLEDIAGVQAPRLRGATTIALPLSMVGLQGSSRFEPLRLQMVIERYAPHSLILLPQMLLAWSLWLRSTGQRAPASLRLVAVGGAAVGSSLLQAAREVGIPAYEGYGLSEGGSVQTLNLPGDDRPGSAGRVLPHAQLRIAPDGEIEVAGALFLGYLGSEAAAPPAWWPSGDLGTIDADGYLHVRGRKKQVLITSFGRNVSPEWIETELQGVRVGGLPPIAQAVVLGEGRPALGAVLWPLRPDLPDAVLQVAVDAANEQLPDYARIARWVRGVQPFAPETGLATANGRPRRAAIERLHRDALFTEASTAA